MSAQRRNDRALGFRKSQMVYLKQLAMSPFLRAAALLFLAAGTAAHATQYPHVAMSKPSFKWSADQEPPAVLSWHVHIT
jgi:hypothetical protein